MTEEMSPRQAAADSNSGVSPSKTSDNSTRVGFRVIRQRGAGVDGTCFEAFDDQAGVSVELHRLGPAMRDARRGQQLASRLRLLASIRHPGIQAVRQLSLESEPPFACLDAPCSGKSLADLEADSSRHPTPQECLRVAGQLCGAVVAGHRLGLAHGALNSQAVVVGADAVQIDFSGLCTRDPNSAPLEAELPNDVAKLAKMIDGLLSIDQVGESLSALSARKHAALKQLLRLAITEPPHERPLAHEIFQHLVELGDLAGEQAVPLVPPAPTLLGEREQTAELSELDLRDRAVRETEEQKLDSATVVGSTVDISATQEGSGLPIDAPTAEASKVLRGGDQLGRYKIVAKIGEGGMGAVYKATDIGDDRVVAIKTLKASATVNANALIRFQKEGRMLAAVNNPYVTNLIEVNEDEGLHYIALEFVDGVDLSDALKRVKPLPERQALAIAADVARALVDAHERGIVHRDIKPENILLEGDPIGADTSPTELVEPLKCKLSDFGIARHIDTSQSMAVTQAGAILGTPLYMSPEQCKGQGDIVPQSDVYSLGVTLFELLTGALPFQAMDPLKLIAMHCFEAAPSVNKVNPRVSEAAASIVAKALSKRPEDRFNDAAHFLREIDQLLLGKPSDAQVHPVIPTYDPSQHVLVDLVWDLDSSPEELWPFVSNTDRLNRAIGLPAVTYRTVNDPVQGVRRFGSFKMMGMTISWEEHPFEWIEGRRMGVVREFEQGPFKSFINTVELERLPQGTRLKHRIFIVPASFIGKVLAKLDAGKRAPKSLEKVYRRVDRSIQRRKVDNSYADAFEEAPRLSRQIQGRIETRVEALAAEGVAPDLASQLGEYVATAPAQELAKIQPLALAKRLGADEQELLEACLLGCNAGLLTLQWDVLCPTCRVAADTKATLKELQAHTFCEACNVDFDSDAANSVELVFRVHRDLREAATGKYCIGGPAHTPHVAAQLRVAPQERIELELALSVGEYLLRGPNLPQSITLSVQLTGPSQLDLPINAKMDNRRTVVVRSGGQLLRIQNGFDVQQVIRLERVIPRKDVITAAQASALRTFRKLFPGEVFEQGRLVSAEQVTLLVTSLGDVDELYQRIGDAEAFTLIQQHLQDLEDEIEQGRGALVKSAGEGVVAAFEDAADAVTTAFRLQAHVKSQPRASEIRMGVGVHRGPAIVTTVNDRLDYFGGTARIAAALPEHANGGVLLTEPVFSDPVVADLLCRGPLSSAAGNLDSLDLPGKPQQLVQLFYAQDPGQDSK